MYALILIELGHVKRLRKHVKPNVLLNIYISNRIRHLEWNSIMNRSYTHFPYKMYFKWSHDVVGEQSRDHWNI